MTTVTVTVSFPSTAWTNEQLPDAIADEVRSVFWECDHDDVTVATTATSTPQPVTGCAADGGGCLRHGEKRRDDTV